MRVKVCFMCREYIPILENDYLNKEQLEKFDSLHSGHPVQSVNKEEIMNIGEWKPFL
ncbi:unnamed protein product [marine sediment metagenome]|uniref:Uncharacterized protein n=1 Tax=marine sediment metagenome TaxID=412755 RepID=X1GZI1_9ZZZZ